MDDIEFIPVNTELAEGLLEPIGTAALSGDVLVIRLKPGMSEAISLLFRLNKAQGLLLSPQYIESIRSES